MKLFALAILSFTILISGCTQAPDYDLNDTTQDNQTCYQKESLCCLDDSCSVTEVLCTEGSLPKFLGCNPDCTPNVICESQTEEGDQTEEESIEYVPAKPDPEYDSFTWTLPTGASELRLSLPADIDDFLFNEHGGIGGFGLHAGGHIEGVSHAWIELKPGTPVKSWADGTVDNIQFSGDEYHITINYGQNLVGTHMEVMTPYVEMYETVIRGQEVGLGMSFSPDQSSGEFGLVDRGRTDGVEAFGGGVSVSPFDYLADADKKALVDAYKENVIEPWVNDGAETWGFEPSEPYLTNNIFIHEGNEGMLTGTWYLTSQNWEYAYPSDMLVFIEADNPYYKGNIARAMDHEQMGGDWSFDGNFEVDYGKGQVKITDIYRSDKYGIFEIDETGDRAVLKIEYNEVSYPSSFSSAALTYIQRTNLYRGDDAVQLGVFEY